MCQQVQEPLVGTHELAQILSARTEAGSSPGLRDGWAVDRCRGRPVAKMAELPNWDRLITNTVTFVLQLWALYSMRRFK